MGGRGRPRAFDRDAALRKALDVFWELCAPCDGGCAKGEHLSRGVSKVAGMILSMATTKITVTIPEELAAYVREQVESGRFDSVSAYMTRAAESLRDFDPLDLLIASMVAETGEPDEAAKAWADEALAKAREAKGTGGSTAVGDAA